MLLITFSTGDADAILDYTGELVSDFLPLIVIILGISIGLWILDRLLFKR